MSRNLKESTRDFNAKTGMVTAKISDYQETSGFTAGSWNQLFGHNKANSEWRQSVFKAGNIEFPNKDQRFEWRKIQLTVYHLPGGETISCVPWELVLNRMMGTDIQQGSEQENVEPSTPGSNLVSQVTEGILDRTCKLITPVGNNGVMQNTELSVQNQNCRRRDTTICRSCEKLWNIVESRFESTRASQVALPGVPLCAAS